MDIVADMLEIEDALEHVSNTCALYDANLLDYDYIVEVGDSGFVVTFTIR